MSRVITVEVAIDANSERDAREFRRKLIPRLLDAAAEAAQVSRQDILRVGVVQNRKHAKQR